MFDTKKNINNDQCEQASGDTMTFNGTNNFAGNVEITSQQPVLITGSTIILSDGLNNILLDGYQVNINSVNGSDSSLLSMSSNNMTLAQTDSWGNGYYSLGTSSGVLNVGNSDYSQQSYFYMSPYNFSLTYSDDNNNLNASLFLGGYSSSFQCGQFILRFEDAGNATFTDTNANTAGLQYGRSNYWTGFTNSSLTNKEYVDFHQLKVHTVSSLPSATVAGRMIYVSDESGGSIVAFSDGTNWRRMTDRNIVS